MIAKFQLRNVEENQLQTEGTKFSEILTFNAVTEKPFNPDGESDDNSFARWTPTGELKITVTNPAMFGKFKVGTKYYLTFTEATE